jgi:hypothetical protein
MEELKWQWRQQVDKVKCQCDSMFLALEEPMKMGLAWFVFSLLPLPHLQLKSWLLNWQFLECVTSMFASEIAATTRQSDGRVMLQLHTTCIKPLCRDDATIAMKNTNWSKGRRKIDGNKKESCYNWSSLCFWIETLSTLFELLNEQEHGSTADWVIEEEVCAHRKQGRKKTCAATNCASSVEAKLEGFVIFKKHWSQMWLLCIL